MEKPLVLVAGAAALAVSIAPAAATQPLHAHEACSVSRSAVQCAPHDHIETPEHLAVSRDVTVQLTGVEAVAMVGQLGVKADLQFT